MLPQYSGGLGILAGDHLKAASDLGVPIIGVGLLYRHGYFKQSLSREGWQQETYPVLDPDGLPLSLLREADGSRAHRHDRPARRRRAARPDLGGQVGRVPLLLLDSDIEENPDDFREVTDRLYGGNSEHRLRQEMLLGIGGVRALRAYSRITGAADPEVFHTNEGHAGFLGLERIRELTVAGNGPGLDFDAALEVSRAGTVFTTHTPVPAGIDRFPRELVEQYFGGASPTPGVPVDRILALGRRGLRRRRPGRVQHGRDGLPAGPARQRRLEAARRRQPRHVRRAVAGLRRARGADHLDHQRRARPDLGRPRGLRAGRGRRAPTRTPTTPRRSSRPSTRSPATRSGRPSGCCASGSSTTPAAGSRKSWAKRGAAPAELDWIDSALDPDVLTIGFARRVPSYKRLTLMLRDPERLKRLLLAPGAAGPAGHRRQVAPGRRRRQEADPGAGAVRRRPGGAAPDRVPAQLRHRDGAAALPRLRRVAEQPAAALRGLRHLRHEGRAQRRPQPVDPRRLVGRVVRRQQRLGDPVRRRRRRPRPPRRHRGHGALRPDRERGRAALLRRRRGRRARPLDRDGPAHPEVARPEGARRPGWSATTSASSTRRPRRPVAALNADYAGAASSPPGSSGSAPAGRRPRRARREQRRRRRPGGRQPPRPCAPSCRSASSRPTTSRSRWCTASINSEDDLVQTVRRAARGGRGLRGRPAPLRRHRRPRPAPARSATPSAWSPRTTSWRRRPSSASSPCPPEPRARETADLGQQPQLLGPVSAAVWPNRGTTESVHRGADDQLRTRAARRPSGREGERVTVADRRAGLQVGVGGEHHLAGVHPVVLGQGDVDRARPRR